MIEKTTDADAPEELRHTNALVDQTSPYLLQHAHNPVDWRPWGGEAFAEALRRDVPIFLSIGYSTCYWCHVMERQVFENETLAAQMNEQFVCIKVDREERPDVDDIYMTATQLLTGSGGWPMSVFLTPPAPADAQGEMGWGLKPFWCGTYIPPQPMHGRPGFGEVMHTISGFWKTQRQDVLEQAERVADAVRQQVGRGDRAAGPVDASLVNQAAQQLLSRYDPEHGGFGGAQGPKFPTPVTLRFLQAVQQNTADTAIGDALHHTLDRMARGGMYDQVGGGFHRYSVDEKWLVPHFEKMLYDNGQLLELYAEAYAAAPDQRGSALYARVIRETAAYLEREMRDDSASGGGALWSAQDAEVNTMEGGNYVWTEPQVREALADHVDSERLIPLALQMYGLDQGTNFQDPHHPDAPAVNVLYMPQPMSHWAEGYAGSMAELMSDREAINAALLKVRDQRDQPSTDDKVLAGWNGLAIAGLARGGAVLEEPELIEAAARAADAVLQHMSQPDGGLQRSMRRGEAKIPAFLEDYAFFVHGLLELHRALPGDRGEVYLEQAKRLMAYTRDRFAGEGGGYFDTLKGQADLFVRSRSTYDGAIASGNSQMAHNLLNLYRATGDEKYLQQAAADLRSFAVPMRESGAGMSHMVHAALRLLEAAPPAMVKQLAEPGEPAEQALVVTASVSDSPVRVNAEGAAALALTLRIAEGFHINASQDLPDGLIPTKVGVTTDGWTIQAQYPAPQALDAPFADEPLPVYSGELSLPLTLRWTGEGPPGDQAELVVHYQACDDQRCLRPDTLTVLLQIAME